MNEKTWAVVGKFASMFAILGVVATITFNLYDRTRGPSLTGPVRFLKYPVSPYLHRAIQIASGRRGNLEPDRHSYPEGHSGRRDSYERASVDITDLRLERSGFAAESF